MKRIILVWLSIGLLVLTIFVIWSKQLSMKPNRLSIGSTLITIERATTDEAKNRGLSYRTSLAENSGMLFLYAQKSQPTYWMYEMHFPIDIVWLADDTIIDVTQDLPIPTNGVIATASASHPINAVLELNAGFVKKHDIKVGDTVKYQK